jgi:hypothetical protein
MDVPSIASAQLRQSICSCVCSVPYVGLLIAISAALTYVLDYRLHRRENASKETLLNQPGILLPEVHPASSATLADNAEVIGVLVNGRPRAYALGAFLFSPIGQLYHRHVVNDLLAGVPITITYCDQLGCTEVYTDSHISAPLPIAVGGFTERDGRQSMLLCVGDFHYRQDSAEPLESDAPPFPYAHLKYVRMSWKQWRTAHPDTDVYLPAARTLRGLS